MKFVPPTSFDVCNVKVQLCVVYKCILYNFLPHAIITIIIIIITIIKLFFNPR